MEAIVDIATEPRPRRRVLVVLDDSQRTPPGMAELYRLPGCGRRYVEAEPEPCDIAEEAA